MPLDNGYFIKDLDPSNPVGTIDKVSLLDDVIREVKGCVVNTFPSMDGQVEYSTDELNKMKKNFAYKELGWDMNKSTLRGVTTLDADDAVLPRSENDKRYLKVGEGLGDAGGFDVILEELFADFDYTSDAAKLLQVIMNNMSYPIGSLYFQAGSDENPSKILNVGIWVKFGQGRAIIGAGECNDGQETQTWKLEDSKGTYNHKMTVKEMPAHTHAFKQLQMKSPGPDTKHNFQIAQHDQTTYNTESAGGSEAHNNTQPSIAVCIWKRTK